MKKNIRRIGILLLVIVLFASLLIACSTPNNTTEAPSNNTTEGPTEAAKEPIDLAGVTLKIAQFTTNTTAEGDPFTYLNGTLMADIALKRLADIGQSLNCTIELEYNNSDDKGLLVAALGTNPSRCDLVFCVDENCVLTTGNALLPILDYNDIIGYGPDTFEIYGPPNLLQVGMYNGELYYLVPYSHPGKQVIGGKYFAININLIKQYNNDLDIREYYEQGNWNWTNFENIVKTTSVVENGETTLYGAQMNLSELCDYALISNGFTRVVKGADGKYVANFNSDNAIEALTWVRKIQSDLASNIKTQSRAKQLTDFEALKTAMIFMTTGQLKNKVAYLPVEFAVLPFPVGPRGNWETNEASTATSGFAIYAMTDYPEACAQIIHDYCQPFEEYPNFQKALEYEQSRFWDPRDVQVIVDVQSHSRYTFNSFNGNLIADNFGKSTDTPQECIEKYSELLTQCIQDWHIPVAELTDKLLGE